MLKTINHYKLLTDAVFDKPISNEQREEYLRFYANVHPQYFYGLAEQVFTDQSAIGTKTTATLQNKINTDVLITQVSFANTFGFSDVVFNTNFRRAGSRQGFWLGDNDDMPAPFLCRQQRFTSDVNQGQQRPFPLLPFVLKANDRLFCDVRLLAALPALTETQGIVAAKGFYLEQDYTNFNRALQYIRASRPKTQIVRLRYNAATMGGRANLSTNEFPRKMQDPCYILAISRYNFEGGEMRVYDRFRRSYWSDVPVPVFTMASTQIGATNRGVWSWDYLPAPYFVDGLDVLDFQISEGGETQVSDIYLLIRTV